MDTTPEIIKKARPATAAELRAMSTFMKRTYKEGRSIWRLAGGNHVSTRPVAEFDVELNLNAGKQRK